MAIAVARFMILAKSDRIGSKDKKEEEKNIRYSGLLSLQKIDLTKVAKEYTWGEYWSKEDIPVKPQEERFCTIDIVGEGNIRIVDLMTREEYMKSLM